MRGGGGRVRDVCWSALVHHVAKRHNRCFTNCFTHRFFMLVHLRYKDLLGNLPQEVKDDRYCTVVLNRIAGYGSVSIGGYTKYIHFHMYNINVKGIKPKSEVDCMVN